MAEVRKKVLEDKYNTAGIKKSKEKEAEKKVKKNTSKKKENKQEEKKSLFVKIRIFFHGVKSEFEKVHWPSKEDMIKYSVATIVFIVFLATFFYFIDVIFALIQSLFS